MRKSRFNKEQIIRILKEVESSAKVTEVIREHGICAGTFYRWRAKFGWPDVSEARRLKQLENENRRLKRMVSGLSLDKQALNDVLSKKW